MSNSCKLRLSRRQDRPSGRFAFAFAFAFAAAAAARHNVACVVFVALIAWVGCRPIYASPPSAEPTDNQTAKEEAIQVGLTGDATQDADTELHCREFRFIYGATVTKVEPGTPVRVWLPVATERYAQRVRVEEIRLPAAYRETTEKRFGNRLLYFEAKANTQGEIPIYVSYLVDRSELTWSRPERAGADDPGIYLSATRMVPVDEKLSAVLWGAKRPDGSRREMARHLYDAVDAHMKYDKPEDRPGWGQGDAVWACGHGFGNCTDFHSLFISAARSLGIPARFEIGFMIPPESTEVKSGPVGGYHCWAKFLADGHWFPVDISEADKSPSRREYYFGNVGSDRVTFTIGRDLELSPPTSAGPVNFLVYPYVEVDGVEHSSFRKEFRYEDL